MPGSMVVLPKIVPEPSEEEEEALILKVQQENNALGLTSIRDLNIYPNAMRAYYRLWRQGKLTLRVGLGLMIVDPGDVEKSLSTWGLGVQFGDNWLRLDSISEEPHPNPGNKLQGTDFDQATQDEYIKAMIAVNRYDWRPAPHVSDDGSLDLTLDAYEAADRDSSIHEKRWVVEHIPTVKPDQIERLEKLGVVVSAQFQPYNGGGAMPEWAVPMRDMLDHHLIVGAGSDSHGLTQTDNPFVPFYFYVTRKTKDGKVIGLKEKISREEALRVSTINNAYLTFEEKVKGSIEPGKLADFVILNQDIMTVPDEQILSTHPLATYVGGREVFASKGGGF
jgi:predicted amidohydrolase YtcJ